MDNPLITFQPIPVPHDFTGYSQSTAIYAQALENVEISVGRIRVQRRAHTSNRHFRPKPVTKRRIPYVLRQKAPTDFYVLRAFPHASCLFQHRIPKTSLFLHKLSTPVNPGQYKVLGAYPQLPQALLLLLSNIYYYLHMFLGRAASCRRQSHADGKSTQRG